MRPMIPLFLFAAASAAFPLAAQPVPVPPFQSVELHGGGIVTVAPAAGQRVTLVEGSRQFTRFQVTGDGKLVIDSCAEPCPRNYRPQIRIESPAVRGLAIDGGGMITTAAGFRPQSDIGVAIHGGGKIDARSILAGNVGAAIHGGGQILVRSRGSLGAAINGGGQILYWGNPAVTSAIRGGGVVRRGD